MQTNSWTAAEKKKKSALQLCVGRKKNTTRAQDFFRCRSFAAAMHQSCYLFVLYDSISLLALTHTVRHGKCALCFIGGYENTLLKPGVITLRHGEDLQSHHTCPQCLHTPAQKYLLIPHTISYQILIWALSGHQQILCQQYYNKIILKFHPLHLNPYKSNNVWINSGKLSLDKDDQKLHGVNLVSKLVPVRARRFLTCSLTWLLKVRQHPFGFVSNRSPCLSLSFTWCTSSSLNTNLMADMFLALYENTCLLFW